MKKILFLGVRGALCIAILLNFTTANAQNKNKIIAFKQNIKKEALEKTSEPLRIMQDNGVQGIELEYQFLNAEVADLNVDNKSYNFIHIKGFNKMQRVGAPALPAHIDNIAVPIGAKVEVSITETEYIEYTGYYIHPALKPATDTQGDPEPQFEIDEKIYGTDKFFPENLINISTAKRLRGITIASVQIVPVQFNPVTKTIRVYSKIKYSIDFKGERKSLSEIGTDNSEQFVKKIKNIVLNTDQLSVPVSNKGDNIPSAFDYIIVTHTQYLDAAHKLAEWKSQLGYTVEIISQSSWTAEQVKAAIRFCYENYTPKPDYLVIIGDHAGSYAVPGEIHHTYDSPPESFATDLYFTCMDGIDDYVPDIAYGRISVSSIEEANIVVDKIIRYEKNPPDMSAFYSTLTHCAQFQDDNLDSYADRRFAQTAEEALQYMIGEGYTVNRVYAIDDLSINPQYWNNTYYSIGEELPSYIKKPTFTWDGDKNDIADEVNAGRFLVLHRDHGYVGGFGWGTPEFLTSDIDLLDNGNLLPVLFSINCHTGEYQLPECFAEGWLRSYNKGAVGVIAAAYTSLSGYNDAFTSGMYDAIWPGWQIQFTGDGNQYYPPYATHDAIYRMGDVMNQGLFRMTESWGGAYDVERYQFELFHWFGDPAMRIWTSNPNNNIITAIHESSVACDASALVINNSTSGSLATLVFDEMLIGQTILDNSGNGTINFSIPSEGNSAILTISKHDCKPYIAEISITGSCIFAPLVNTVPASGITANTTSIGGEIVSNGGSAVTVSGVVYSLNSNPLLNAPGSINVPSNPTVTSGTFSVDISDLVPGTNYYYRAYATNAIGTNYGDNLSFQSKYSISFPYIVTFENEIIPEFWTQEDGPPTWLFITGNGGDNPAYAHGGLYNACLKDKSRESDRNKMITPYFDLSSMTTPILKFWHIQKLWSPDQDELRVYYRNSESGFWNLMATYANNIPDWTQEIINLPNPGGDYYIAFEGDAQYGNGVCIDDIEVLDINCSNSFTQASDFNASAISSYSMDISWTRGNGDEVMLVVHQSNPVDSDPVNGKIYNAIAIFGSGELIGSGNYVVYKGTGNQVSVSNLLPGTTYYFSVYEYSSLGCYTVPALTGNATTTDTPPITDVSWTGAVSSDWNKESNWSDGNVPTIYKNAVIPSGCVNYPVVDEPSYCKDLIVQDAGSLIITDGAGLNVNGNLAIGGGSSGSFTINGGSCVVTGDFLTELGCNINITGGIFNFTNWERSNSNSWSAGTITLSGGTINASGSILFSSINVAGTMNGPFTFNVGDDLYLSNNAWITVTGGTINLLGTGTAPFYFLPSNTTTSSVAYNLNINAADMTYMVSRSTANHGMIINNNLTVTAGTMQAFNGSYSLSTFDVNGNLTIENGAILDCNGTNDPNINLSGNWINNGGTFIPGGNTVILDGTSQTLSGENTFYNLTKTVTSTAELTFGTGTSNKTAVAGILTLQGLSGQLLYLASFTEGSQWEIDPQGSRDLSYLSVKDSKNTNAININACSLVNSGNNTNWDFPVAAAGTITGTAIVTQGQSGVLYSVPEIAYATSYLWSLPTGATITAGINTNNITVSFSQTAESGEITVQGINLCGSGTISPVYNVTVTPVTGIVELNSEDNVILYPVPVTQILTVKSSSEIGSFEIRGITGDVIFKRTNLNLKMFQHDMNSYNPGIYIINIILKDSPQIPVTRKIIKN